MMTISASSMPYSRQIAFSAEPSVLKSSSPWRCCSFAGHDAFPFSTDHGAHDLFLAGFAGGHFADDARLRSSHRSGRTCPAARAFPSEIISDAFALVGQLVDDRVDFVLRADVDAARRLVEDQHLRAGEQPFRQHHLLLVAAGKVAASSGRRSDERMFILLAVFLRHLASRAMSSSTPYLRHAGEIGQRDVVLDVVVRIRPRSCGPR